MVAPASILLTCEHAGNKIPVACQALFRGKEALLQSHRGWDPGAMIIARHLETVLHLPLFHNDTSRLVVEVNRSADSPELFSVETSRLSKGEKEGLLKSIYYPFRKSVEDHLKELLPPVLHLSIHTFTPVLDGRPRELEVGILFDPSRTFESAVAEVLRDRLAELLSGWRIQYNEPYKGVDDGFTTTLRSKYADHHYAGIEIEANQKLLDNDAIDQLKVVLGIVVTGLLLKFT